MRSLLVSALSTLALTSMASIANATLECKGKEKDANVSMSVLDLSATEVAEGIISPVGVRITETAKSAKGFEIQKVLFAGVVNGATEDVQWFLNSTDQTTLSGTIFLDELYDLTMTVNGRAINMTCEL